MFKKTALAGAFTAALCLATTAQADHKNHQQSEDFVTQLVKAALPKDASVEGLVNSGSLGVTLFLSCEIAKGTGAKLDKNDYCARKK